MISPRSLCNYRCEMATHSRVAVILLAAKLSIAINAKWCSTNELLDWYRPSEDQFVLLSLAVSWKYAPYVTHKLRSFSSTTECKSFRDFLALKHLYIYKISVVCL